MDNLATELMMAIAESQVLDIVDVRQLARVNSAWRSALLPHGQLWGRLTHVMLVDSSILPNLLSRSKLSTLEWDIRLPPHLRSRHGKHGKQGPLHGACKALLTANFARTRSLTLRLDGQTLSKEELNALFNTRNECFEELHIFFPRLKGLPRVDFRAIAPNLRCLTIQLSQLKYLVGSALEHVTDVRVVTPPYIDLLASHEHRLVHLHRVAPRVRSIWLDSPPLDTALPAFTVLRELTVDARRANSDLFRVADLQNFFSVAFDLFTLDLFTLAAPPVEFSLPIPSRVEELSVLRHGGVFNIELKTLDYPPREVHRYVDMHKDVLSGLARSLGNLEHLALDLWLCPATREFVDRLSFSQLRRLSLVLLPDEVLDAGFDGINLLQDEKLNQTLKFPALRRLTLTTAPVGLGPRSRPRPQLPPSSRYSVDAGDVLQWITSRELELNQKFELGIDWRIHVEGKSKIKTLRGLTIFIESIPFFED
ncbi:hypothetical protein EXIGLDRAFT_771614 [Exidia glandulosa HHB12029]|uniref:F-box domain-containing protein n=1 Tax=Exidia glandulosa HHB12029 TaxID=1314781 RepID=A0A166A8U7_EXIGL|nr:hypothetical protein EXIGLDRAFT_771614 [Exidia glandulosa HHB12029]